MPFIFVMFSIGHVGNASGFWYSFDMKVNEETEMTTDLLSVS